jgi:ribosomal protein L13E
MSHAEINRPFRHKTRFDLHGAKVMSNYKIKVNIEIVECQEPVQVRPVKLEEGCFEFNISAGRAYSIDDCEQALLETNYSALREALKQHLSEISKKN